MSNQDHFDFAARLIRIFDTQFRIGYLAFGLDAVLDFIPWLGGFISAFVSCYLLYIAYLVRVPRIVYVYMILHICIDYFIGQLPFGSGIFIDALYKANVKNFELIKRFAKPDGVLEGVIVE